MIEAFEACRITDGFPATNPFDTSCFARTGGSKTLSTEAPKMKTVRRLEESLRNFIRRLKSEART